ncbi:MAG: hypothetical protein ABSE43_00635 [Steroidobacteraceae bacterium]|jgi:hypothetical protein
MTDRPKPSGAKDLWQKVREPRSVAVVENQPTATPETGCNPYDTFPNLRANDVGQRQSDLRRLSEWIRVKRQVEALKSGKPK